MRRNEKTKLREIYALKQIATLIKLDKKLLKEQINMLSNLTAIVNDEVGDCLVGALQVLEIFEWLPKGEYDIKVKIE